MAPPNPSAPVWMDAVRAHLDGLANEYGRLCAQLERLAEDNGRLNEELLALGIQVDLQGSFCPSEKQKNVSLAIETEDPCQSAGTTPRRVSPRSALSEVAAGSVASDPPPSQQSATPNAASQQVLRRVTTQTTREWRVDLWQVWTEDGDTSSVLDQSVPAVSFPLRSDLSDSIEGATRRLAAAVAGDVEMDDSCLQPFVVKPTDRRRLVWDMISIFALTYDLLMLPLFVFSALETYVWIFIANTFTTSFWLIDVLASCFSGYYVKGRIEMRPRKIVVHYFKGWFCLDAFLSSLDVALLLAWRESVDAFSILRFGKYSRIARALRLFRLIRVIKVISALRKRAEVIKSDVVRTLVSIVHLLIAMVICNHFVACGWYALGTLDGLPSGWPTWVTQVNLNDAAFPERDDAYLYTTALHWSFTQFTPASMEVVPRNPVERSYNIIILLLGLVMFSSLISSITNAMTKLRERNFERSKQQENLSEYFQNHRVSLALGNHIYAFLQQQGFSTRRPVASDIPVLNKLPERLRKRLHGEVYQPVLTAHPLFFHFDETDGQSLLTLCHLAMSQFIILDGQHLFQLGGIGTKMYFVSDGAMEYYLGMSDMPTALIKQSDHISEAPLWVNWEHKGRLDADKDTEVAVLDSHAFRLVIRNTRMLAWCRVYARKFYAKLIDTAESSLTDLPYSFDELQEMVHGVFESTGTTSMGQFSLSAASTGNDSDGDGPSNAFNRSTKKIHRFVRQVTVTNRRSSAVRTPRSGGPRGISLGASRG